jgi:hypothetical protein
MRDGGCISENWYSHFYFAEKTFSGAGKSKKSLAIFSICPLLK